MTIPVRKGQAPDHLGRDTFSLRFRARYEDPAFEVERDAIARLEAIAWQAYEEGRKAPLTQPAGDGFADPRYDMSVEWLTTKARLDAAQARWALAETPSRVLVVCASARNDGSCPGEISKTWRLAQLAESTLKAEAMEVDLLDLSALTSEYGRQIHPCKGCASTAMPLCHWPCSCYPNHSLDQVNDWMGEIYERWVSAHGVVLLTPTYWYQSPSPLKLMIDRLVCADGGNPDPSSTHGKTPEKAKAIEKAGWDYPQHLAGRVFGLVVHGDVAGVEAQRQHLGDWLSWMGLINAGQAAQLDRYIGYYGPYWNSHEALDADDCVQAEVKLVAQATAAAVRLRRSGQLPQPDAGRTRPRRK